MAVRKARTFILACFAAAALIAASPVWAQKQPATAGSAAGKPTTGQEPTRDPATRSADGDDQQTGGDETAKDRNSIECFDGKSSDVDAPLDPNCGKDDALDPRFPGRVVVTLPDILVDLFGGSSTTLPRRRCQHARWRNRRACRRLERRCRCRRLRAGDRKRSPRTAAGSTRRQTHPQRFSPLPPDDRRWCRRARSPAPSCRTRCWSPSTGTPLRCRISPRVSGSTSARNASPTCSA